VNAELFKQRFWGFHPKLYRIAFVLIGNEADAEDVLQELYTKLWSKRDTLDEVDNPEAFAVTLLKHMCIDFLRSPRGRQQEHVPIETVTLPNADNTEHLLETADELLRVRQLIETLPEAQRTVLKLRSVSDCSTEEIAALTGYSETNVRTLLLRARRSIKEKFYKHSRI
jgi:RNA polymerase sigma-70 factor (ECF subfamily)